MVDPNSTTLCQYCQYEYADGYLTSLNFAAADKWRYFGIFLAFVISNWALVYFFIWSCRIKGWSFGMGYLFGFLGKVANVLLWPFTKLTSSKKQETPAPADEEKA